MAYEYAQCPGCGDEYKSLGRHWNGSPSHRPQLTKYQKEVITGILMSDGELRRRSKNPSFRLSMIVEKYIRWIGDLFGSLSRDVVLSKTAKGSAEDSRRSGFNNDAKEENYHDYWTVTLRSNPELKQFSWYTGDDGEKVWPEDLDLTGTVLTHLYVGDGSWNTSGRNNRIQISSLNEFGNQDKINSYFDRKNIPKPSNYNKSGMGMIIEFSKEDSRELFEYMDPAPPGFEYKFPEEYHDSSFYE